MLKLRDAGGNGKAAKRVQDAISRDVGKVVSNLLNCAVRNAASMVTSIKSPSHRLQGNIFNAIAEHIVVA